MGTEYLNGPVPESGFFSNKGPDCRGLLGVTGRWPGLCRAHRLLLGLQKLGVVVSSMGLFLLSPLWEMHLSEDWVRATDYSEKQVTCVEPCTRHPTCPFTFIFRGPAASPKCNLYHPATCCFSLPSRLWFSFMDLMLAPVPNCGTASKGPQMFSLTSCETGSGLSKERETVTTDTIIRANMW